ncbi:MAG TPA: cysteine synthase family protein [bacterium]|nr:cysteine synthase family protein [bacterium]
MTTTTTESIARERAAAFRSDVDRGILDLIGHTPLVRLGPTVRDLPHRVYAKLEYFNPTGSVKDRLALFVLDEAERRGWIKPGDLVIDNSSGNTAVSVAMVARQKGYRALFTVPDKTSAEKIDLIRALGAEVVICPTDVPHDHPDSYYSSARRIARERGAYLVDQYHNPLNIEAHYRTTGPEIWQQMDGQVDVFIAGIGTGGTLSGIARYLKEVKPGVRVLAVDPVGSIFHELFTHNREGEPGRYYVEGIGTDTPCGAMDFSVVDEVLQSDDAEAFAEARRIVMEEGLIAGGSAGSAMAALRKWCAANPTQRDLNIVTLFADSGMRYLSKFLSERWMKEKGFAV